MWTQLDVCQIIEEIVADLAPGDLAAIASGGEAALRPDTRLVEDCGYHSLALMELAMSLEDEFGLPEIDESIARRIQTVGDIQQHVIGELTRMGQVSDSEYAPATLAVDKGLATTRTDRGEEYTHVTR